MGGPIPPHRVRTHEMRMGVRAIRQPHRGEGVDAAGHQVEPLRPVRLVQHPVARRHENAPVLRGEGIQDAVAGTSGLSESEGGVCSGQSCGARTDSHEDIPVGGIGLVHGSCIAPGDAPERELTAEAGPGAVSRALCSERQPVIRISCECLRVPWWGGPHQPGALGSWRGELKVIELCGRGGPTLSGSPVEPPDPHLRKENES